MIFHIIVLIHGKKNNIDMLIIYIYILYNIITYDYYCICVDI